MEAIEVEAQLRSTGKREVQKLRAGGFLPATVFGDGKDNLAVKLNVREMELLKSHSSTFVSSILNLLIDKKKESVIIKDYALHPVNDKLVHLDLQRLPSGSKKIKIKVALFFINASTCPGVKSGGVAYIKKRFIEAMCSAGKIVNELEIDIAHLEKGQMFTVYDIKFPEGVTPLFYRDTLILRIIGGKKEIVEGNNKIEKEVTEIAKSL